MPRVPPQDRLQPSLLDRLTDEDPSQTSEAHTRRVLTMQELRQGVLRDLTWLLNTGSLEDVVDLGDFPEVAASTLNYGIPHLSSFQNSGVAASDVERRDIERRLRLAIWRFEPRLLRDSVKVELAADEKSTTHNAITIFIEGKLWAEPVPWDLFLKTEADLELTRFAVTEHTGREGK
jgi:type VI secretion system protein ImpF